MSRGRPWTEEELSLLMELVGRNVSLPVMALKLGRSMAAIEAKAAQQKIALRRRKRAYHRKPPTEPADISSTRSAYGD
jgi:hypothetical protein